MSRTPNQPRPEPDDALPPALWEDLSALYAGPRVPPAVDAKVLNAARATLAGQVRRNRWLRWAGAGAAAAAAAVIVVVAVLPTGGPTGQPVASLAGDVDGSGRVDILDAFSLARQIRDARDAPVPVTPAADVNGDNVIDRADVDRIAETAVRASGGPPGSTR